MSASVLISNGVSLTAGTITVNGTISQSGPKAKRDVIDMTALEDTVTFQGTGILSYADGMSINGGCETATFKMLTDHIIADDTFTLSQVKGGQTATGTYKVTMVEKKFQKGQTVNFDATFTPTGNVTPN
jgi:hypothetical protein